MKKCISCKSEISPQARFCERCGVLQPLEKGIDDDRTVRSSEPATDSTLFPTPLIPPPPPPYQSEGEKENENKSLGIPLSQFSENKLAGTGSMRQPDSQMYGEHLQPQQLHGEHLQPQQLRGLHQQPYSNYQQPLNPMTQAKATVTKVGATATKAGTSAVGKWVIIAVIAVTVLGASGIGLALAFHLFTPQPVMSVVSIYNAQGRTIAVDGTTLHVSGQKFAANSPITFLLDNTPLKENNETQSDANGNVTAELTVTSTWSVGRHQLTAHDANNVSTTSGIEIDIVQPGQSHTPGPNGAPPDDASFTIHLNIQATMETYGTTDTYTYTLIITGHPDPVGGTVCSPMDDGKPVSSKSADLLNKGTDTRTRSYSCSGTYKGGVVSYAQTLKTETVISSNGSACTLNNPEVHLKITGSYTDQHNFSGHSGYISLPTSAYTCTPASYTYREFGDTGTWTGTVSES